MKLPNALKLNRYGEHNIQAPKRIDLINAGIQTSRLRKPLRDTADKVLYQFQFPPRRGPFYLHYIYTVNKFMENLHLATKQSQWQGIANIIDHHLAGTLVYFELNPQQFGGSFTAFAHSWVYNALYAMRSYNIKQAYLRGELLSTSTKLLYEPLPKPLDYKSTQALAEILYDLVYPRLELIRKKSGLLPRT